LNDIYEKEKEYQEKKELNNTKKLQREYIKSFELEKWKIYIIELRWKESNEYFAIGIKWKRIKISADKFNKVKDKLKLVSNFNELAKIFEYTKQ